MERTSTVVANRALSALVAAPLEPTKTLKDVVDENEVGKKNVRTAGTTENDGNMNYSKCYNFGNWRSGLF